MRILYLDIDTLRADHLGCYGYQRSTSGNIDRMAAAGVRFDKVYVSDAPCLPSRASMFTGRFGIHTGVVNHGGSAADIRPVGSARRFNTVQQRPGLVECLRRLGIHPVSISPFAERHSAWWFCAGWREMYNPGRCGQEIADEVTPLALDWIRRNAARDGWLLHVNYWDPHTPYRTPESFGNPFAGAALSPWYGESLRQRHWDGYGPHSAREPMGRYDDGAWNWPRVPRRIASLDDYRRWIDGYDCSIRYADEHCGRIFSALAEAGVLDQTVILITSDHGENQGELGVYGDHQTADHVTCRVPLILRWPGVPPRVDHGLHYQTDVAATLIELLGGSVPENWDGRSFAEAFRAGESRGRAGVVFSQMCWSCQRAVRWEDWLFIRTYHTGLKELPGRMLFDVAADPHEQNDLAAGRPDLADHGQALIEQWTAEMMSASDCDTDPLWTVMREGGPFHVREIGQRYLAHLRATGRGHHADFLEKHPTGLRD